MSVGWSPPKLWYFPTLDFSNFWPEVRYRYSKNTDEAGLSKKNLDHSKMTKTYFFCTFWPRSQDFDFSQKNWYDILKGTIESYHPWKNEQILRCGSENMADFVKLTEWSKRKFFFNFFQKIFFFRLFSKKFFFRFRIVQFA